jgi:LysM repeat protein
MAENDLHNVFEDCIVRLNSGQSIEECLRSYPQHAALLRPMLEAGHLVYRASYTANETAQAQARVHARVAEAARAPKPHPLPYLRLAALAATLVLVFVIAIGGGIAASQSSLPGDWLYRVKRTVESVRMSLSIDSTAIRQEIDQRRIAEIQQLIALGRTETVDFEGMVQVQNGANWVIEGLPVMVSIPDAVRVGERVRVDAYTTPVGQIVALSITVVQPNPTPLASGTPVPTIVPATRITPTAIVETSTPGPTHTATATNSPPITASPTSVPTEETTVEPIRPTQCVPAPPSNWGRYIIQTGDTLSALASARGVSITQVMVVNCLANSGLIVAGQFIYLPVLNLSTATPAVTVNAPASSDNSSGSGSQQSGGGGPKQATDDHGSKDSGHDSGDDHGGGSDSSGHG